MFGVCAGIDKAMKVHEAGYDFMECTVVSLQPEKSDTEVQDTLALFLDSPIPVKAFNVLLPGDLSVVGEQVDEERIRRYLAKALERVKRIGGETIVFGSGRARMVPEGFSRERAEEQIIRFLHMVADETDPLEISVVIEPLNKTECNILNSVPEAVHYAKQVNRQSIQVLADSYHMLKDNEPLENIVEYSKFIRHVHVAGPERYAPGVEEYSYDQLVDCLNRANYKDKISIECKWSNFEEDITKAKPLLAQWFQP